MKRTSLAVLLLSVLVYACSKTSITPVKNDLTDEVRSTPLPPLHDVWLHLASADQGGFGYKNCAFTANGKGYVILGIFNQLWEYNEGATGWVNKGTMPTSISNSNATAFSIGNKGYFYNNNHEFWEYDAVANTWTAKANFPGVDRTDAIGFSIGSKGYVGTGLKIGGGSMASKVLSDFWEYNPATNQWIQKANTPGMKRSWAMGYSAGGKGYIGAGRSYLPFNGNEITINLKDWWEYNNVSNTWTQKADFPGLGTLGPTGFVIGDSVFTGMGTKSDGSSIQEMFYYRRSNDTWLTRNSPTESFGYFYTTAFSAAGKGYYIFNNLGSIWKYWR